MRTILFSIFIILFNINAMATAPDLKKIREDYIASISNSETANALCAQLQSIKNPDALILAYLGSAQAIKAKHAWNPVNKMSYLKQGFSTINQAVNKDPNHLEVRFLRFSLQYYVPTFLGYSKNIDSDKDKIIMLLQNQKNTNLNIDKKIIKDMVNFMIDSKRCDAQEIAVLRKVLA
jgi:hypothetical protein